MPNPSDPAYKQAWDIMMEVDNLLHDEEDAKGNLKATGEARGLNKMRKSLTRVIDGEATAFLKQHGFNGYGQRKKR